MGWSKLLDVEVTPFELITSLTVIPDGWRRLWVGVLAGLAALVTLSIAALPRDPGPRPDEREMLDGFCAVRPLGCDDGELAGIWAYESYDLWRDRRLERWARRKAAADAMAGAYFAAILGRLALTGVLAFAASGLWRLTRPIEVRRSAGGLQLGSRRIASGQLAALEVRGPLLRLHARTHGDGEWTSPPLWIDPVELDALVAVLDDDVTEPPDERERAARERQRRAAVAIAAAARRTKA